jgi:hypothetical protein
MRLHVVQSDIKILLCEPKLVWAHHLKHKTNWCRFLVHLTDSLEQIHRLLCSKGTHTDGLDWLPET